MIFAFSPLLLLLLLIRYNPTHATKGTTKLTQVAGYWQAARASSMPPSAIDYTYLAHVNYAFYTPDVNGYLHPNTVTTSNASLLSTLVKYAHAANTQVLVSLGGASGSTNFSTVLASETATATLLKQCVQLVNNYSLDGIDWDYESPTNLAQTNDAINFLMSLRTALNAISNSRTLTGHPLLSSALSSSTYVNDQGGMLSPLSNVSALVDFFNMDSYSYNSGTLAPNSPIFAPACSTSSSESTQSLSHSIAAYTAAKIPKSKINVGVPFYSRQAKAATAPYVGMTCYPAIASGSSSVDVVYASSISSQSGENWIHEWDSTTRTGWSYNNETGAFSATNWQRSVLAKTTYTSCEALRGISIWSVDMDYEGQLTAVAAEVRNGYSKKVCKGYGFT